MEENITITISKEKLPNYHQVQELLSLADDCQESMANLVNENYTQLVDTLGLEIALIIHFHFISITRARYFYAEEFIGLLATQCTKKQEREKLAFTCGCTLQTLDTWMRKVRRGEYDNAESSFNTK